MTNRHSLSLLEFAEPIVQPAEIGYGLALRGIISIIILPIGMPFLVRCYGVTPFYQFVISLWPIIFLGFPLLNSVAHRFIMEGSPSTVMDRGVALFWAGVAIPIFICRVSGMSFG